MKRLAVAALLLAQACVPRWFIEAKVDDKAAQASAERGKTLLLNKSFLKVGVPLGLTGALYQPQLEPLDRPTLLSGRSRVNAFMPTGYTGRVIGSDVAVATENCLLCHAGALRGEWVLGLGNSFLDAQLPVDAKLIDRERLTKLDPTHEKLEVLEAWERFQNGLLPYSRATSPGTVAALYFTGYLFSHRAPDTLEWVDAAQFPMLETPPPETDIPAWWLLKKKKCLYYGCELKGDFTRSLMQFMTVPGNSGDDIRQSEADFEDVLAFLRSLEAPKYPLPIDAALAHDGEIVFEGTCSECHGHYGDSPSYPNVVVPLEKIGTDPARNAFMHDLKFAEAYGNSWYGEKSKMAATAGYLAPPLDGVWATAPYLHNASVPTLEAVLDPSLRPKYFIRSRDSRDYDLQRVGWKVEKLDAPDLKRAPLIYDTTRFGKGNAGHTFAEKLSKEERRAVLEYLKTL